MSVDGVEQKTTFGEEILTTSQEISWISNFFIKCETWFMESLGVRNMAPWICVEIDQEYHQIGKSPNFEVRLRSLKQLHFVKHEILWFLWAKSITCFK